MAGRFLTDCGAHLRKTTSREMMPTGEPIMANFAQKAKIEV